MRTYIFILLFTLRTSYGLEAGPVTGGRACEQYIESASWTERYDPGTQKNEWSLSVIPTACGRAIDIEKIEDTNAEYAELVQKFGGDWQWKNNDGGGMRRQMVCHLEIARYKIPWNLEPYRPDVTQEVSIGSGCNNGIVAGGGAMPAASDPPWILSPIEGATVTSPYRISGKSAASATIDVCLEGATYCFDKQVADGNGNWFIDVAKFDSGAYKITARQILNGQVSSWATNRVFMVLNPPSISSPTEGASVSSPFRITGKSAANATMDVCLEGAGYCFGKPMADGNGNWFIEGARLSPGTYKFTARQTLNGQVSNWASNRMITVP